MIRESEIRERLAAVISGSVSLEDFEDWLDSESWNMHADSEPAAVQLASEIQLLFSEYGAGYMNEQRLRRELSALLDNVVVYLRIDMNMSVSFERPVISSSNSAVQPMVLQVPA